MVLIFTNLIFAEVPVRSFLFVIIQSLTEHLFTIVYGIALKNETWLVMPSVMSSSCNFSAQRLSACQLFWNCFLRQNWLPRIFGWKHPREKHFDFSHKQLNFFGNFNETAFMIFSLVIMIKYANISFLLSSMEIPFLFQWFFSKHFLSQFPFENYFLLHFFCFWTNSDYFCVYTLKLCKI